jgi:hypothetical protein
MWPGVLRRALLVAGCGALTVMFAACESTQSESAKIEREAAAAREHEPGALKLGSPNRDVHTSKVTLLRAPGRGAVAVKLRSTSARAQARVPVLITVKGKGGRLLYSNQPGGTDPRLQYLPLLAGRASAWWVDDQVLLNQPSSGAAVRVGTGSTAPRDDPAVLTMRSSHLRVSAGGSTLSGELVNEGSRRRRNVTVLAVALRGGKVVAAGRTLVKGLAGGRDASARFQISLVGDASNAKLELTAVPTPAQGVAG